jgi:hypothetical protein
MNDLDVWPDPGEALGDEAAMAALGCGLAAEQATDTFLEQGSIEDVRDTSSIHQRLEARDIPFPVMVFAIVIANLGGRRQLRKMDVASAVEALEKPSKVVLLGEPRELPARFEADIDDLFDPIVGEESEEALGRLLREPDGVELHFVSRGVEKS